MAGWRTLDTGKKSTNCQVYETNEALLGNEIGWRWRNGCKKPNKMKVMKTKYSRIGLAAMLGLWMLSKCMFAAAEDNLLRNHGLPDDPAAVLPQGAVLQVHVNNFFQTLLNVERLAKATVPEKAVPQQARDLLALEHPLLTVLGQQVFQSPLDEDKVAQMTGLNPGQRITLTLYPGDPRKSFVACLPMANAQGLENFIKAVAQPRSMEGITVDGKPAVRIELRDQSVISELFVVCSERSAFICGDRSLVLAMRNLPSSQRLKQDGFMTRAAENINRAHLAVIFNPGLIKPFLMPLQQFRSMAQPILRQKRSELLAQIPPEVKERLEDQWRKDLGIKDLDQMADYAECFILATFDTLLDMVSSKLLAFEGVSVSANLDAGFPKFSVFIHSNQYQPEKGTAPIPLEEVRKAMAWLGKDYHSFSITGRQQERKPCPFAVSWFNQLGKQMETRGLKSSFIEKLARLQLERPLEQPLSTAVPWVLNTRATLNPLPAIRDFESLDAYWQALARKLALPMDKGIHLVPGKDSEFLAGHFRKRLEARNREVEMNREFVTGLTGNEPWLDKISRFDSRSLEQGVKMITTENAYITHSGIFGYDQHEFINRKIYLAREVDGYLLYHQGTPSSKWLAQLKTNEGSKISPALAKLMDQVPEGADLIHIEQALYALPEVADWLGGLEKLIHSEMDRYLAEAARVIGEAPNLEEAKGRLKKLNMPALVFSLNRDEATGKLYALLPGGMAAFPRPKIIPILEDLLSEYAARANELGGCITYSRTRPEVYEWSVVQSTEALSFLIKTVVNRLAENYLGSPEKMQQLQGTLIGPNDARPENLDELLIRNARWSFLPGPKPQSKAKPTQAIPERDSQTPGSLVDLSAYYNASLTESWHAGGLANNTLKSLPQGVQELGGVKFDVRGIVQLAGRSSRESLTVSFPKEIKNIKIGGKAKRVHFLHATGWASPDGTLIGRYIVHFADGQREIPIVYGKDVRDWWPQANESETSEAKPAWTGKNTTSEAEDTKVRLFITSWDNPNPEAEITAIDYCSEMAYSSPFLIAITLE